MIKLIFQLESFWLYILLSMEIGAISLVNSHDIVEEFWDHDLSIFLFQSQIFYTC